jgi:hypothetical protein
MAISGAACAALALAACSGKSNQPASQAEPAIRSAQITALETRADRVKDTNDVKRLQRAYGFYLDQGDWDHVADLFAADASIEYANEGVYVGQQRIREYLKRLGGGHNGLIAGRMNNHLVLQPVVHVAQDGLSARARWRSLIMLGQYGQSASWGEGTYENEYVKHAGVWKIKKLHWYVTFVAPYEGGWAKVKPEDAIVSAFVKEFPPDRPPSLAYKPYPAAFVPPYYYGPGGASQPPAPDPAPESDLAQWSLEIARLEAHEAIENLQAMYGYYLDKNQWDSVADLFTENATYEIGQRGVYRGKKRVREALNLIGPAGVQPGLLNNELQLQPVIHVSSDGRSAKARWRTLEMKGEHGKRGAWGSGIYENEYALEQGRWKISKLHYYVTFRADYDEGWLKRPLPIERVSEVLPPDAPPTEVYGSLPDVYLPPYHYSNPGLALEPRKDSGTAPPELRSLAKKIGLLNDEIEVQRLQRAYGYYVDKNMWDEVTELFADDATLEIGGRGVFVGKKRVREYMHYLGKPGPQHGGLYDHSQWQLVTHVSEDGTTAKQRLRALIMAGLPNAADAGLESSVFGECTYENEYVKIDGVWKIARLYSYFNMYTPYAEGWGRKALPNTRLEKRLAPDRAPTRVYETYPAIAKLEYHYRNPVTGK